MNATTSFVGVLIVEDNPADAEFICEQVAEACGEGLDICQARSLAEATDQLRKKRVDVVLLDLGLPDGSGIENIRRVRSVVQDTPIIVLTGLKDAEFGLACIGYGAHDFLNKDELDALALKRAMSYAISRVQELRIRELESTLARYRALSSEGSGTSTTASLAGSGAVALRRPEVFQDLVIAYCGLLERYQRQSQGREDAGLRRDMERTITQVGDHGGGPRDLVDLHLQALRRVVGPKSLDSRRRAMVADGRLLALEMMGLLVDYYRVGHRRRFGEESR